MQLYVYNSGPFVYEVGLAFTWNESDNRSGVIHDILVFEVVAAGGEGRGCIA